jgi:hypothetical protein
MRTKKIIVDDVEFNARYWYKDEKHKLQKYVYCGLCLAGPFKVTDENILFTRINNQSHCIKCTKTAHALPVPRKPKIFLYKEPG